MPVLQALTTDKLPKLQEELQSIKCSRLVLQWIPSHFGILGNELADKLAKLGAADEQEENLVNLSEMKTIIKSLHKPRPLTKDGYHQLTRQEQTIIFRLRTGHNRLNNHMNKRFHLVPSPLCPCGQADQTTEHILQDCGDLQVLREEIWSTPCPLQDKLYGSVEFLRQTASFILMAKLQV